ncbi:MAG TPA: hypothetical protein VKA38_14375, partial [Draconibacterium sp.]|nr:hypothetical protein [Draconibacterium sp.]
EILKNALINFTGTVLVVSHDREFLDGLVYCVYEFRNKKIKQHLGGIYNFLQRRKIESLKELEIKSKENVLVKENNSSKNRINNFSFEEKKEINRNISKFEKLVENTESEISKLENEISEINKALSSSETLGDHSIFDKYEQLKKTHEQAMERWETEHEELENWKQKKSW